MTTAQMKRFWAVFNQAVSNLGIQGHNEREEYRHTVLRECGKVEHLKDVSPAAYERIIARLAADAGDFQTAADAAIANDKRIAAMIDDCVRQLLLADDFAGRPGVCDALSASDRLAYVIGILHQMGYKKIRNNSQFWWMDFGIDKPLKVFQIVDTHRRRLFREAHFAQLGYKYGLDLEEMKAGGMK